MMGAREYAAPCSTTSRVQSLRSLLYCLSGSLVCNLPEDRGYSWSSSHLVMQSYNSSPPSTFKPLFGRHNLCKFHKFGLHVNIFANSAWWRPDGTVCLLDWRSLSFSPMSKSKQHFCDKSRRLQKRSFVAHLFLVQDTELLLHQAAVSLLSEGVPAIVAKLA